MYRTGYKKVSEHIRIRTKENDFAGIRLADTLSEIILANKELFDSVEFDVKPLPAIERDGYEKFVKSGRI